MLQDDVKLWFLKKGFLEAWHSKCCGKNTPAATNAPLIIPFLKLLIDKIVFASGFRIFLRTQCHYVFHTSNKPVHVHVPLRWLRTDAFVKIHSVIMHVTFLFLVLFHGSYLSIHFCFYPIIPGAGSERLGTGRGPFRPPWDLENYEL